MEASELYPDMFRSRSAKEIKVYHRISPPRRVPPQSADFSENAPPPPIRARPRDSDFGLSPTQNVWPHEARRETCRREVAELCPTPEQPRVPLKPSGLTPGAIGGTTRTCAPGISSHMMRSSHPLNMGLRQNGFLVVSHRGEDKL